MRLRKPIVRSLGFEGGLDFKAARFVSSAFSTREIDRIFTGIWGGVCMP